MTDFSKLSDAELMAIVKAGPPKEKAPSVDVTKLSDDDLQKIVKAGPPKPVEQPGLASRAVGAVQSGIETVDAYTMAPLRAAVGSLQDGGSAQDAILRGLKVWGEDQTKPEIRPGIPRAPTSKEIATKAGLSDKSLGRLRIPVIPTRDETIDIDLPSPAGMAGFVGDVALDPTNLIPLGVAAKFAGKGIKTAVGPLATAAKAAASPITRRLEGSAVDKAAKLLIEGGEAALDAHLKPSQAPDWDRLKSIAEANGIDAAKLPESVEFGPLAPITSMGRGLREGPVGAKLVDDFKESFAQVEGAVKAKAEAIGGGSAMGREEAGEFIRERYNDAYQKFFDGIETTYDSVIKDYPGLKLSQEAAADLESKLLGIERFAAGRLKRGATQRNQAQAQGLLNTVAALRETNGSVKQTVEALRDIGEAAFGATNYLDSVPPDVKKMRDLYSSITESLHKTLRQDVQKGAEVSDALRESNARMREWFGEKSVVSKTLGESNLASEKVFERLLLNGDTRKVEALNFLIGPEAMQQLKGSVLSEMVRGNQFKENLVNFNALRNTVRDKQVMLGKLLTPDELKSFDDLVQLGDRFGDPRLSTSGTGGSNKFADLFKSVPNAALSSVAFEGLKGRARSRGLAAAATGVPLPESVVKEATESGISAAAAPSNVSPMRSFIERAAKRTTIGRTKKENTLKALQVGGAQSASQKAEEEKQKKGAN